MKLAKQQELYNLSKAGYSQIAKDFDRTRKNLFWPPLKKIVDSLPNGARILDLGCGDGRLLNYLGQRQIEYVGLDNSPELLAIASTNYPGAKFIQGNILALNQAEELKSLAPFDCILAIAVWHHLPGRNWQVKAIQDALSYLTPNGRLVIVVQNFWHKNKYLSLLWQNVIKKIKGQHRYAWRDLVFPWYNSKGQALGKRYYHVYNQLELKKISHLSGGRFISLKVDRYNYYLQLGPKSF